MKTGLPTERSLNAATDVPERSMSWCVKGAILSGKLALSLSAPRFQNYAMSRQFDAFSRTTPAATRIGADVYKFVLEWNGTNRWTMPLFIEDLIVRNWGDSTIIDHGDEAMWATLLFKHERSRRKFLKASMLSLEKRREQPLKLSDYHVKED